MKFLLFEILMIISCLNLKGQDIAYGRHNAIYLAIYHNYELKVEDYNTQNRSIDLSLLMNISYATINFSNADGQRSYVLENASIIKSENDNGRTIYSIYYDSNKKLSFFPHKENQVWFTTVIYWPDKNSPGGFFKYEFGEKLIY
jgi:hypothetical protein